MGNLILSFPVSSGGEREGKDAFEQQKGVGRTFFLSNTGYQNPKETTPTRDGARP